MPEQDQDKGNISRTRRSSTWEFLPNLELPSTGKYKFNESVLRDRHLFRLRNNLKQKNLDNNQESDVVELPIINQIQLSLDLSKCDSRHDGAVCSSNPGAPLSARFNEPLNAYVSARKKTCNPHTPGYLEAFPRSLPSVDQSTMAKKLVNQRRAEQRNLMMGRSWNEAGLLPLLRMSQGNPKSLILAPDSRDATDTVKMADSENTLHVWDPTQMDLLMKMGKVLVRR